MEVLDDDDDDEIYLIYVCVYSEKERFMQKKFYLISYCLLIVKNKVL